MIKVLIADDQELIRQSLQIVLNACEDIEVVATAQNGREVLAAVRRTSPDVGLMDIRMPEMDGIQCTKILKENDPGLRILVLTTFDDDQFVYQALKHGACGYLLKGVSMEELANAVRTAAKGGSMIHPTVASKVLRLFAQMAQSDLRIEVAAGGAEELGRTERRIVEQVGRGLSNREIAQVLGLSEGTVRNYLSTILGKLGLRDRTQLAIWSVQTGFAAGKHLAP